MQATSWLLKKKTQVVKLRRDAGIGPMESLTQCVMWSVSLRGVWSLALNLTRLLFTRMQVSQNSFCTEDKFNLPCLL